MLMCVVRKTASRIIALESPLIFTTMILLVYELTRFEPKLFLHRHVLAMPTTINISQIDETYFFFFLNSTFYYFNTGKG